MPAGPGRHLGATPVSADGTRADDVRAEVPTDEALAREVESGTGALRLDLTRRLAAEGLGTGLLVMAVVGSGIAASRLSAGDVGL